MGQNVGDPIILKKVWKEGFARIGAKRDLMESRLTLGWMCAWMWCMFEWDCMWCVVCVCIGMRSLHSRYFNFIELIKCNWWNTHKLFRIGERKHKTHFQLDWNKPGESLLQGIQISERHVSYAMLPPNFCGLFKQLQLNRGVFWFKLLLWR